MASVRYRDDRRHWEVIYNVRVVTVDEHGVETSAWKKRRRKAPSKRAAEALAREIETEAAHGRNWSPERKAAVVTVGALCRAYLAATARGSRAATSRTAASYLQKFLNWAGEDRPAADLTSGLLRDYSDSMTIKSVARYVSAVEGLWQWAYDNGDTYPGVPPVRRITGKRNELKHPQAKRETKNPTYQQVDTMLAALAGHAKRLPYWRMALIQRFTGLRVSQILSLAWDDLDLDRCHVHLRADAAGAKGGGGVTVPIDPRLAAELATWGVRSGQIFERVTTKGPKRGTARAYRNDEVAEVFGGAWARANVPRDLWAPEGAKGRQTNAMRGAWKTQISRADGYELAALLAGQNHRGEAGSYLDRMRAYGDRMRAALATLPDVGGPYEATEDTGKVYSFG